MSSLFIARKNSEKNGPSTTYPAVLVLLFLDYVVKTRTSSSTSCTLNAKDKETGKLSPSPRTPAILDGSIQEKKIFLQHNISVGVFVVVQFAQSCLTLCDPMNCSTPGFPILHYLLEFAQIHAHWVIDAIGPSHSLLPPSPPALNLSQQWGWGVKIHILYVTHPEIKNYLLCVSDRASIMLSRT